MQTQKRVVSRSHGTISTEDAEVPPNYLWRIVCNSSVVPIIRRFSMEPGEHLQVKTRTYEGCNSLRWIAHHINKKSILVAIGSSANSSSYPTSTNSSFVMSYICLGKMPIRMYVAMDNVIIIPNYS